MCYCKLVIRASSLKLHSLIAPFFMQHLITSQSLHLFDCTNQWPFWWLYPFECTLMIAIPYSPSLIAPLDCSHLNAPLLLHKTFYCTPVRFCWHPSDCIPLIASIWLHLFDCTPLIALLWLHFFIGVCWLQHTYCNPSLHVIMILVIQCLHVH